MHNKRLHTAVGHWDLLWLDAGSQESTSVCISHCGIRSGLTTLEEQEMLLFTLISVLNKHGWWNISVLCFQHHSSCIDRIHFYALLKIWSVFNNMGTILRGRLQFGEDTSLQSRVVGISINGSGSMTLCSWCNCFSQNVACPGLNKWICKWRTSGVGETVRDLDGRQWREHEKCAHFTVMKYVRRTADNSFHEVSLEGHSCFRHITFHFIVYWLGWIHRHG